MNAFYIIISSLLFTLTLFFPSMSIITMTTFLLPLHKLYKVHSRYSFLQGCLWGVIVFGTYWYWIILLFKNQELTNLGCILWACVTIWGSIVAGLWMIYFDRWPTISTVLFFIFLSRGLLIPLGSLEGAPTLNPLVLISQYKILVAPLYYVGDTGMLTFLFGIQNYIAQQKFKSISMYIFILIMIGGICWLFQKNTNYVTMPKTLIIIPWWYNQKKGAMFDAYRLTHDLICNIRNKDIKIILTPESTFCFDLYEYNRFISLWSESADNIPILLGTHVACQGYTHNALLLLHNKKIVRSYFKTHTAPFLERTTFVERIFKKTFLSKETIPQRIIEKKQNDLLVIDTKVYQLFMCSEFFMEAKKVWSYPILLVWNDTWLSCDYAKNLAMRFIEYFELKYGVRVFHIATSGVTNIYASL